MLVRVDPFRDVESIFDELHGRTSLRRAPLDAYRRGDTFFVHIDVPGIDPDAIELTVEDDVLSVKGERTWAEKEGDELVVCERPQGSFERRVYLGPTLDREHLEAHYDRGVLTVRVPVLEAARPHRIPIAFEASEGAGAIGPPKGAA